MTSEFGLAVIINSSGKLNYRAHNRGLKFFIGAFKFTKIVIVIPVNAIQKAVAFFGSVSNLFSHIFFKLEAVDEKAYDNVMHPF